MCYKSKIWWIRMPLYICMTMMIVPLVFNGLIWTWTSSQWYSHMHIAQVMNVLTLSRAQGMVKQLWVGKWGWGGGGGWRYSKHSVFYKIFGNFLNFEKKKNIYRHVYYKFIILLCIFMPIFTINIGLLLIIFVYNYFNIFKLGTAE